MMDIENPAERRPRAQQRRILACIPCRNGKLRCDRNLPCRNCRRGRGKTCAYVSRPEVAMSAGARQRSSASHPVVAADAEVIAPPGGQESQVVSRVIATPPRRPSNGQRWHSLSVADILLPSSSSLDTPTNPNVSSSEEHNRVQEPSTEIPTTNSVQPELTPIAHPLENLETPIQQIIYKTGYFSSSHWIHSFTLLPNVLCWYDRVNSSRGEHWQAMQSCKLLSRRLQEERKIPWIHGEYGKWMPSKDTADLLIDAYLRTLEGVYRILHIPTFKRDYALLWQDSQQPQDAFLVQFQLCMALGVCLSDDTSSLRPQALQWVKEAEAWIWLSEKNQLSICGIQNMCLFALARNIMLDFHGNSAWILSGVLVRSAISIGLHRDPTKLPAMSATQAEIRRRLWATVLELVLDSCLDAGRPPLISLDDFDCALPMNLDDTQLNFDTDAVFTAHAPNQWSDTSFQIALARTYPIRHAIATYVNGIKTQILYEEVMKLYDQYKTACATSNKILRHLSLKLTKFQCCFYELIMSRYTFSLHIPYAALASNNPTYCYSRKLCVEAAIRLLHSGLRCVTMRDTFLDSARAVTEAQLISDDYVRLVSCGLGPVRSVHFQAIMVIAAELFAYLADWADATHLAMAPPLGDLRAMELLSLIRTAKIWGKSRILAGNENPKDYIIISATLGGITAMLEGNPISEAIELRGKEACFEAKSLIAQLVHSSEPESGEEFHFEESWDSNVEDFWTADLAGFENWGIPLS